MHLREQNERTSTQTWLASPMIDADVLVFEWDAWLFCTATCRVPTTTHFAILLWNHWCLILLKYMIRTYCTRCIVWSKPCRDFCCAVEGMWEEKYLTSGGEAPAHSLIYWGYRVHVIAGGLALEVVPTLASQRLGYASRTNEIHLGVRYMM